MKIKVQKFEKEPIRNMQKLGLNKNKQIEYTRKKTIIPVRSVQI